MADKILTPAEMEEIEARLKAATPGPWSDKKPAADGEFFASGIIVAAVMRGMGIYANPPGGSFPAADQQFIAHCPTDIATFISSHRALEARNATLEAERDALQAQVKAMEEALEFCTSLAREELEHAKVGTGCEVALRHIARKAADALAAVKKGRSE